MCIHANCKVYDSFKGGHLHSDGYNQNKWMYVCTMYNIRTLVVIWCAGALMFGCYLPTSNYMDYKILYIIFDSRVRFMSIVIDFKKKVMK